jgi:hypothetical protein
VCVCVQREAIATLSRADHLFFFFLFRLGTLIQLSQLSTSCRERKRENVGQRENEEGRPTDLLVALSSTPPSFSWRWQRGGGRSRAIFTSILSNWEK